MIYFISGHLDLTEAEFNEHYKPALDKVISESGKFIVGDAAGADAMSQEYLFGKTADVKVYHMFENPRHNCGFDSVGGFRTDKARDEAMTENSNKDIAWVRPGREKSGTAKNLKRRLKGAS